MPRERSAFERHTCSADDCTAKFASLRELNSHYKAAHAGRRPIKCPPCRKTFSTSKHLKRHMKEKHSVGKRFSCDYCKFTTARLVEISRHMKRRHKDEYALLMTVAKAQEDSREKEGDREKEGGREEGCREKEGVQESTVDESSEKRDTSEDDDIEDDEDEGILRHLQIKIRMMRRRYNSLAPVELLILANLRPQRKKAREVGLGSSSSEVVRDVRGARGRKRTAVPDVMNEPTRQSPRLLATQAEYRYQHREEQERQLEAELLGDVVESDGEGDATAIVESVIKEMMELAVSEGGEVLRETEVRCYVCEKLFNRTRNLTVHLETMHSVLEETVKCSRKYCTRHFSTKYAMIVHRRLCIFKCGGCGRRMKRDDLVLCHMRKCNSGGQD